MPTKSDFLAAGVTYRQLDYWTRTGYLRAEDREHVGSGGPRSWPAGELDVARRMCALVAVGVTAEAAHYAARNLGLLPGGRARVHWSEDNLNDPLEQWALDLRRAPHPFPRSVEDSSCDRCCRPAQHKVCEQLDTSTHMVRSLSVHLCCEHFTAAIGDCASYPYATVAFLGAG